MSQPGNKWFVGEPINVYYNYVPDGIYQYEDFDIKRNPYNELEYTLKPTIDTDGDGIADKALSREDNVKPGSVKIKDIMVMVKLMRMTVLRYLKILILHYL